MSAILQISEIITDAGTQIRSCIDEQTVAQYAADMVADISNFPFVDVFTDGSQYILADGFHRLLAHVRNGRTEIKCEVHKGTRSDALRFALVANAKHGLKRTSADKRRSVVLALKEWPAMSNAETAKVCAVDDHTVSTVRKDLETASEIPTLTKRQGVDGKTYTLPKKKTEEPKVHTLEPITPEQHQPEPPSLESKFADALPKISAVEKGIGEAIDEFLKLRILQAKPSLDAGTLARLALRFDSCTKKIQKAASEMRLKEAGLTNTSAKAA